MKSIFFILSIFLVFQLHAQEAEKSHEYLLEAPDQWRKEIIPFPLGFAPSLDYQGIEEIRFAKGWADKTSDEFWSYKFMWYLDADPELTEQKLEHDLSVYFDGLMGAVGKGNDIPSDSITATKAVFLRVSEGTFKGKVITFDSFFLRNEKALYFKVRSFYCKERDKYVAYFDVSPQPADHNIWKEMSEINLGGACQ